MILTDCSKPLELFEIDLGDLSPNQVLVKIIIAGVCHTQLLEARGMRGPDRFLPHCMGHEAVGIVISVGDEVTKVKPNDNVALTWIKCSGHEAGGSTYSLAKSPNTKINSGPIATFARHAKISENRIVKIDPDSDPEIGSILGCALATSYGLVNRTAQVDSGEKIGLVGMGGLGTATLIFLKLLGVKNITAFDINDRALKNCTSIMDIDTINVLNSETNTLYNSFDCIIETSGNKSAMELAFKLAKKNGGRVVYAGNLPFESKIEIDPFDFLLGKKVIGCGNNNSMPDKDFPEILKLVNKNKSLFQKLISLKLNLEELNDAFLMLEKHEVTRVILNCER
jgi:S-(hydroxymethyl)glutathione dehydrogenase/alcohol dehydrogenase